MSRKMVEVCVYLQKTSTLDHDALTMQLRLLQPKIQRNFSDVMWDKIPSAPSSLRAPPAAPPITPQAPPVPPRLALTALSIFPQRQASAAAAAPAAPQVAIQMAPAPQLGEDTQPAATVRPMDQQHAVVLRWRAEQEQKDAAAAAAAAAAARAAAAPAAIVLVPPPGSQIDSNGNLSCVLHQADGFAPNCPMCNWCLGASKQVMAQ